MENGQVKRYEDITMDLFKIRSVQEITTRLGDTCLDDQTHPAHPDALFMYVWNKINKDYDDDINSTGNKIGLKLKKMQEAWMLFHSTIDAKVNLLLYKWPYLTN